MRIFLVSPQKTEMPEEERAKIEAYCKELEKQGHKVFRPLADIRRNQTEIDIYLHYLEALKVCDEVHVWYAPKSGEVFFGFGIAFVFADAWDKKIVFANKENCCGTEKKSLVNLLFHLAEEGAKGYKDVQLPT